MRIVASKLSSQNITLPGVPGALIWTACVPSRNAAPETTGRRHTSNQCPRIRSYTPPVSAPTPTRRPITFSSDRFGHRYNYSGAPASTSALRSSVYYMTCRPAQRLCSAFSLSRILFVVQPVQGDTPRPLFFILTLWFAHYRTDVAHCRFAIARLS